MSRINLMNAVRSFHLDHKNIVKLALVSDVKCKNWGQDRTFEVLQDFDNIISASLEKEIDEALAGNTEPTLARFKELSDYKENEKEVTKAYHKWKYDFLRWIKHGNRKNALWLATHSKQCLIFYSLHVDKELFTRNTILECIQFTETPYGINEEYYYAVKQKIREERIAKAPTFKDICEIWQNKLDKLDKSKPAYKKFFSVLFHYKAKYNNPARTKDSILEELSEHFDVKKRTIERYIEKKEELAKKENLPII